MNALPAPGADSLQSVTGPNCPRQPLPRQEHSQLEQNHLVQCDQEKGETQPRSPFFVLATLKKRKEFQEAGRGPRFSTPAFTLVRRLPQESDAPQTGMRFGFTVTKKVGSSPERNRIRRRLREAVRAISPHFGGLKLDLVILARREALSHPFEAMQADLLRAVQALAKRDRPPGQMRREKTSQNSGSKSKKPDDSAPSVALSGLAKPPSSA